MDKSSSIDQATPPSAPGSQPRISRHLEPHLAAKSASFVLTPKLGGLPEYSPTREGSCDGEYLPRARQEWYGQPEDIRP